MENRVIYTEKKAYNKYDESRYMVYLSEEILPGYVPGDLPEDSPLRAQPVTGYAYTGMELDGGTIIQAHEATYEAFVNGLIRQRYMQNEVEAIQSNMLLALADPENDRAMEFRSEWETYQQFRQECKANANTLLNL